MSVGVTIALVIVLMLAAAAAAVAVTMVVRGLALRRRFGPEYDRLARDVGPRRAQAELADRRRSVAELGLRPLTADQRARYAREWTAAQERFIDNPGQAAQAAAALVTAVATDRGYRTDDPERLMTDLSVGHARLLDGYRRARAATRQSGTAATEELRQALLAYRALFLELAGVPDGTARPAVPAGARTSSSTAAQTTAKE